MTDIRLIWWDLATLFPIPLAVILLPIALVMNALIKDPE